MESFSLTWKEYQNVATGLFSNLSNDKDFADVTLVCTDNKQVHSHKVILNAGSSLFKEILSTNFQRQHALLYLKGRGQRHIVEDPGLYLQRRNRCGSSDP